MPLKLIFAGTPEFSAIHLKALIDSEHQLISGLYPTRPARRPGQEATGQPGQRAGGSSEASPFINHHTLRDPQEQARLAALGADVMIVVAYGLILPTAVLQAPRLGCLNVHASLLPRWRGAAPIQRAIEAGDSETGITIMQMDEGLDTGAMLATASCPIDAQDTAASLHDQLAQLGAPLLQKVLEDLPSCQAAAQRQDDSQATYASKITKSEAEVQWARPARELDRLVRAFNPFPICFTHLQGQRVKIWQAQPAGTALLPEPPGTILRSSREGILVNCGQGQLMIQQLQLPGGEAVERRTGAQWQR